jgi:hypothetical protein
MEKCIFHKNLEFSFGAIVRWNYQGMKFAERLKIVVCSFIISENVVFNAEYNRMSW